MTSPGAQVSGPGAYSKRTDTGGQPIRSLPDPKYGEAGEFAAQQKAAPLAEAAPMPPSPPPSEMARPVAAPRELPGLFDPGDPSIPMTAGAPIGPGPSAVTGGMFSPQTKRVSEQLAEYASGDGGEAIAWLANTLAQMGQ